jgi:ABC-type transport system substrate-binding protein
VLGIPRGFVLQTWEAGKRAVFTADESAPGGRPFLDTIEIQLGRLLRDQSADFELGKADVVELGPSELRRTVASRHVWSTSPVRLLSLAFAPRIADERVRQALALALDRAAIHSVLLQKQGEVSGGLLPQWLTGYAFLFSTAPDAARARAVSASAPASLRSLTLAPEDSAYRTIADRIALNARDAGLMVTVVPASSMADVRLIESRIDSPDASHALASLAAALGLGDVPAARTPEEAYAAERGLLEGYRVVPLFHLPDVYGTGPRVKGGAVITPLGEWRFDSLWLDDRP